MTLQISPRKEEENKSSKEITPKNSPRTENNSIPNVPSPFKTALFWPSEQKELPNKRRNKEKLPAMITSDKWIKYHKAKTEKKKKEEEDKKLKKIERLKKIQLKKEQAEIAKAAKIVKKEQVEIRKKTTKAKKIKRAHLNNING